jgi:protein-disulfide isomerase-like protein with CxxC motif
MPLPIFAVPVALQLIAATVSNVPTLDVTPSCRAAAAAQAVLTDRMRTCVESEQKARYQLVKEWTKFTSADRSRCVRTMMDFDPTYTELLTCLEIANNAKSLPEGLY